MDPGIERQVRAGRARFLIPWAGVAVAALALAALGFALAGADAPDRRPAPAVPLLLAGAGALCGLAVLLLDRGLLGPARIAARLPAPDPELALRHLLAGHLALWSFAAVPAILGFGQLLLGGALRTHLALCGVTVGALAYLMPTRSRLEARVSAVLARRS